MKKLFAIQFLLIMISVVSGLNAHHCLTIHDYSDNYQFGKKLDYELSNTNKKGKTDTQTLSILLDGDDGSFGIQMTEKNNQVTVIYDAKSGKFINLVLDKKGNKSGTIISEKIFYKAMDLFASKAAAQSEGYEVVKTGQKKEMLNYTFEQYTSESKDENSEYWMSKDLVADFGPILKLLKKSVPDLQKTTFGEESGVLGEMISVSKKDKSEVMMKLIKINESGDSISTEGYEIMDVSSFGF